MVSGRSLREVHGSTLPMPILQLERLHWMQRMDNGLNNIQGTSSREFGSGLRRWGGLFAWYFSRRTTIHVVELQVVAFRYPIMMRFEFLFSVWLSFSFCYFPKICQFHILQIVVVLDIWATCLLVDSVPSHQGTNTNSKQADSTHYRDGNSILIINPAKTYFLTYKYLTRYPEAPQF